MCLQNYKMASGEGRSHITFTAEEVARICAFEEGEELSDIDSDHGGMSSGEESEIDRELEEGVILEDSLR